MVVNQELVRFWNPRDTGDVVSDINAAQEAKNPSFPFLGVALVVGIVVAFNMLEKKRV